MKGYEKSLSHTGNISNSFLLVTRPVMNRSFQAFSKYKVSGHDTNIQLES